VIIEKQEQSRWCWAAAAVSIHNFLNGGAGLWTQKQLATPVLRRENQIPEGVDCTQTPALCDTVAGLHDALEVTGNLRTNGFRRDAHLTFDNIKIWVKAQFPVGARIVWFGGGAHFIVIDGFREFESGRQQVHVQDSLYGPSFQDYEDLVSSYGPGGVWQDTYVVKKSTLAPPEGDQ
jgi:hypothetical protein